MAKNNPLNKEQSELADSLVGKFQDLLKTTDAWNDATDLTFDNLKDIKDLTDLQTKLDESRNVLAKEYSDIQKDILDSLASEVEATKSESYATDRSYKGSYFHFKCPVCQATVIVEEKRFLANVRKL